MQLGVGHSVCNLPLAQFLTHRSSRHGCVKRQLWRDRHTDELHVALAPPKASADSTPVPATLTATVPVQAKAAVKDSAALEEFIAAGCVMSCPCKCKYCPLGMALQCSPYTTLYIIHKSMPPPYTPQREKSQSRVVLLLVKSFTYLFTLRP
jgi:hypothetical protein